MTLPHATALYINPADILPKVDPATLRKRLFSPQRRPVERDEPKPVIVMAQQPEVDEGAFTPVQYLKHLCRQYAVGYRDIIGSSKTSFIVMNRDRIMMAILRRFPHLTVADLARLFNRDRTTINSCLERNGIVPASKRCVADHKDDLVNLLMDGQSYNQIGYLLGFTGNAISVFVRAHGLAHLAAKKRQITDYADTIESLVRAGKPHTEIAEVVNFDPSTISKLVKKMGWKR